MIIGIPREIKASEFRVGATPACVAAYRRDGQRVLVERGAGLGAGFTDAEYAAAGAELLDDADALFGAAEMIVKVKEPVPEEYARLRRGQLLFTYLHLAAAPALTELLLEREVDAVAYETIQLADGSLPCLLPMSAIAGRLAPQEGAKYLERPFGGRGVLLGGVPGVAPARVTILGGGVVGSHAAEVALGFGAQVCVLEQAQRRMYELQARFGARLQTLYASEDNLARCLAQSELVIGAVLVPGAAAPKLIRREHLSSMLPGSVLVDVAVDQGGCAETTRPTTHLDPVFEVGGVQHYCVANMPAAVSRTATLALTGATLPYGRMLASLGLDRAIAARPELGPGLNTRAGVLLNPAVAQSFDRRAA
jgi:alanine dehydrogenase